MFRIDFKQFNHFYMIRYISKHFMDFLKFRLINLWCINRFWLHLLHFFCYLFHSNSVYCFLCWFLLFSFYQPLFWYHVKVKLSFLSFKIFKSFWCLNSFWSFLFCFCRSSSWCLSSRLITLRKFFYYFLF